MLVASLPFALTWWAFGIPAALLVAGALITPCGPPLARIQKGSAL